MNNEWKNKKTLDGPFEKFQIKGTVYDITKQQNLGHPNQICIQLVGGRTGKEGKACKE